jgi:hypothetical protein
MCSPFYSSLPLAMLLYILAPRSHAAVWLSLLLALGTPAFICVSLVASQLRLLIHFFCSSALPHIAWLAPLLLSRRRRIVFQCCKVPFAEYTTLSNLPIPTLEFSFALSVLFYSGITRISILNTQSISRIIMCSTCRIIHGLGQKVKHQRHFDEFYQHLFI